MSRKKSTDDSLDLLLDTICNTFGGIVFISILVVILVNSASESAGNSAPTEEMRQQLRADRRRLNSTSEKLSQLRRAVRQATALQEKFGDAEAKVILADLATLQSSTNQVHEQRDESLDSLAAEQEEINEAASQLQKLKQIMRQTQSTLDAARQQLKNEIALRSRTSELPRQRAQQPKRRTHLFNQRSNVSARPGQRRQFGFKRNRKPHRIGRNRQLRRPNSFRRSCHH